MQLGQILKYGWRESTPTAVSPAHTDSHHTHILPFQLNHVETYKKSEKSKTDFDTFKRTSKEVETIFFVLTPSIKIV
jgi:hypothetical protein